MNKLIAIMAVAACGIANTAIAASYSTEATITRQKDKGSYEVIVRLSELSERDGKSAEELIAQPKITSSPGVPARLYVGLASTDPDYTKKENVSVDVTWPEAGKRGLAVCTVIVKLGDKIVSKTKTQMTVEEK